MGHWGTREGPDSTIAPQGSGALLCLEGSAVPKESSVGVSLQGKDTLSWELAEPMGGG